MIKANETLEKLLTIEKAVNEMVTLRQGIFELKESETMRQKALDELRANENRYRILLQNLPQQIVLKDKDSVYTLCNQCYAAELKRKPEEIIGKTDKDLYPGEAAEKHRLDDRRIMTTGQAEDTEESFVREGQTFVVRRVKTPLKDEKGEIIGILGVSWDITEQRNREDELRKNCERLEESAADLKAGLQGKNKLLEGEMAERKRLEESAADLKADLQGKNKLLEEEMAERRRLEESAADLRAGLQRKNALLEGEMAERKRMEERLQGAEGLRRIFEKMATPVILMEENKVISMANAEFEAISGYSKEEVEGKKCLTEFFNQKDLERMTEIFATQGANPDAIIRDKEFQLMDKQGDLRDVSLTIYTIPETKRSVASLMDITETKRIQERIEELEEIYTSLIENASEGVALFQDGILKLANPKIFEIFGYTKEELTSKPFREFILPEDREWFEIQPGEPTNGALNHASSFRIIHKDGGVRWLEDRETLIHCGGDKAVLHFLTDRTHQKQAAEELRISIEPFKKLVDSLGKNISYLQPEMDRNTGVRT